MCDIPLEAPAALTPEQERRARDVHAQSVVILAHDHLSRWPDLQAMRAGGVTAKTVKLTVDGLEWDETGHRVEIESLEGWAKRALTAIDSVYRLCEDHPGEVVIVRNTADVMAAKREGRIGLILGLEGSRPLEGSLEVLRALHRLGLREMQLTWASPNQVITDGELNHFGQAVVGEMNELGMLIDLSHLPDLAFHQALSLTDAPPIVSHNACYALTPHADLMSDDKIRALAAEDGVLAMHFVSGDYIAPRRGTPVAVLDDLIDHIDYIRSLVGSRHIGLGGDYFPTAREDTWAWVREVERIDLLPNITRGLVRRGYSDADIEAILGGNLLRLYARAWRETG